MNQNQLYEDIDKAYQQLGYSLGWRLLYSPFKTLLSSDMAFIGLNPGGQEYEPPLLSVESGSAYQTETWGPFSPGANPLQRQVIAMFDFVGVEPASALSGNFVPFRSPNWSEMPHKQEALKYSYTLWQRILASAKPSLVVCLSDVVDQQLTTMLGADRGQKLPVGWGKISATRRQYPGGELIRLPHLSRFRVFGRHQSMDPLRKIFSKHRA